MKFIKRVLPKKLLDSSERKRQVELIASSDYFDVNYYVQNYLDSEEAVNNTLGKKAAIHHFLTVGAAAGYNPSDKFDTAWYLDRYKDVSRRSVNPLVHYLLFGEQEGRHTKPRRIEEVTSTNSKTTFYSSRTDGFGERLKSLLNAIVLADYYKSDFRYTWNNPEYLGGSHAISSPHDTFSKSFNQRYLVSSVPVDCITLNGKQNLHFDSVRSFKVSQKDIFNQVPSLKNKIPTSVFGDAFNRIDFAQPLKQAIKLAREVPLKGEAVSIHLRSGDIIYGRYRHVDRYSSKVISYAQADYLLSVLKKAGSEVVLFGQDVNVCRELAKKHNAIYLSQEPEVTRLDRLQLALFDMLLMSRSKQIFAGSSGFSQMAELIGDAKIFSPLDAFDHEAMASHIDQLLSSSEVNLFDDFQNAFSCWHLVRNFGHLIGRDKSIRYLEKATSYDPRNLFYVIVLAVFYYENSDIDNSETTIEKVLKRRKDTEEKYGSYVFFKTHKHPDGKKALNRYKSQISAMAEAGLKGADILKRDLI